MITHWLAAITLVPSIFAIVRPKFVERGTLPIAERMPLGGRAAAEFS